MVLKDTERQDLVLYLLGEDSVGRTRLQNIVYILKSKLERSENDALSDYKFRRFFITPKDETLNADVDELLYWELVKIIPAKRNIAKKIMVTHKGLNYLKKQKLGENLENILGKDTLNDIKSEFLCYAGMPADELMRKANEIYYNR